MGILNGPPKKFWGGHSDLLNMGKSLTMWAKCVRWSLSFQHIQIISNIITPRTFGDKKQKPWERVPKSNAQNFRAHACTPPAGDVRKKWFNVITYIAVETWKQVPSNLGKFFLTNWYQFWLSLRTLIRAHFHCHIVCWQLLFLTSHIFCKFP